MWYRGGRERIKTFVFCCSIKQCHAHSIHQLQQPCCKFICQDCSMLPWIKRWLNNSPCIDYPEQNQWNVSLLSKGNALIYFLPETWCLYMATLPPAFFSPAVCLLWSETVDESVDLVWFRLHLLFGVGAQSKYREKELELLILLRLLQFVCLGRVPDCKAHLATGAWYLGQIKVRSHSYHKLTTLEFVWNKSDYCMFISAPTNPTTKLCA